MSVPTGVRSVEASGFSWDALKLEYWRGQLAARWMDSTRAAMATSPGGLRETDPTGKGPLLGLTKVTTN